MYRVPPTRDFSERKTSRNLDNIGDGHGFVWHVNMTDSKWTSRNRLINRAKIQKCEEEKGKGPRDDGGSGRQKFDAPDGLGHVALKPVCAFSPHTGSPKLCSQISASADFSFFSEIMPESCQNTRRMKQTKRLRLATRYRYQSQG
jgi:hypothetical protein